MSYIVFEKSTSEQIAVSFSPSATGHRTFDRIRVQVGSDFAISLELTEAAVLADNLIAAVAAADEVAERRLDGTACVECGTVFVPGSRSVPAGHGPRGQMFACSEHGEQVQR